LTGGLRCYYDDARHRPLRPHCQGIAVVAYGPTPLCATCDAMRSSVGKGTVARPVPAAELARLIDAARAAASAEDELAEAARHARHAGASWTQIGDALGITRQAAQQRWRQP
jgi:2-keto-3-deoxy-L-rhamnonate aldolase RhmA